jgi:hypothetical protein
VQNPQNQESVFIPRWKTKIKKHIFYFLVGAS